MREELVEAGKQRAASAHHDPALHDVLDQLWRRRIQRGLHRADDVDQDARQRFAHVRVRHLDGLGEPRDQVAPADQERALIGRGERRAHRDLDVLRGPLADDQAHGSPHVLHDRVVHLIAPDAHAGRRDHTAERDHGDLRRAAADVDDHGAAGGLDRQPRADRGRHRLFHEMRLARTGHRRGVDHRALFDLRHARWHAKHDPGMSHVPRAVVSARDEVANHLLGVLEVGDHAAAEGTHGHDVGGRSSQHPASLSADREHVPGALADGDHRRFVDDDATPADVDQRVGGSEVDADIGRPDPQHGRQQVQDVEKTLIKFSVGSRGSYIRGPEIRSELTSASRSRSPRRSPGRAPQMASPPSRMCRARRPHRASARRCRPRSQRPQ